MEASATLAQARRLDRLSASSHRAALRRLERLWPEIHLLAVDDATVRQASELAARLALRGYDAVHAASAAQLADPDLVAAAGDQHLLTAWNRLGIATYDTSRP